MLPLAFPLLLDRLSDWSSSHSQSNQAVTLTQQPPTAKGWTLQALQQSTPSIAEPIANSQQLYAVGIASSRALSEALIDDWGQALVQLDELIDHTQPLKLVRCLQSAFCISLLIALPKGFKHPEIPILDKDLDHWFWELPDHLPLVSTGIKSEGHSKTGKVIVFDMESTLIEEEYFEVISQRHLSSQQHQQLSDITLSAMQGKTPFKESYLKRLSVLKGLEYSIIEGLIDEGSSFFEGTETMLANLKEQNWQVSIASGGFADFVKPIAQRFDLPYTCNQLEIVQGVITGNPQGPIVNRIDKKYWLQAQAQQHQAGITIAVGDGANDLEMMALADLAVGWRPKPLVKEACDICLEYANFQALEIITRTLVV